MPACARTDSDFSSISRIRLSRLTSTMMPPWIGSAPPCVPEPPPHGTTGIRARLATFRISAISCGVPGWTMTAGVGVRTPRSSHICGSQNASTE